MGEDAPVVLDLIQRLLAIDPSERLRAEEALGHEWFVRSGVSMPYIPDPPVPASCHTEVGGRTVTDLLGGWLEDAKRRYQALEMNIEDS
jgi:serine/threonine protein kinase